MNLEQDECDWGVSPLHREQIGWMEEVRDGQFRQRKRAGISGKAGLKPWIGE